jgi:hypothetical protein
MSLWSRLFGNRHKYKCSLCGKALHVGTGETMFGSDQADEFIMTLVCHCTSCGQTYCPECRLLKCRMKCARCGADITDPNL